MHTPEQKRKKAEAMKESMHHMRSNVVGERKGDRGNTNMDRMKEGTTALDTPTEQGMSA